MGRIVLKDRRAAYHPGKRSPDWLKVKQKVPLRVRVLEGTPDLVRWGDWGWAARVRLTYTHPRTDVRITIYELVRVPDPETWTLRRAPADVLCWGILPSGRLRHPVWLRWADERHPIRSTGGRTRRRADRPAAALGSPRPASRPVGHVSVAHGTGGSQRRRGLAV